MGKRVEVLRNRLLAVDLLKEAKAVMTYRELSTITGIDETVLAKYVNGSMVPSAGQAERIVKMLLSRLNPRRVILERAAELEGFLDLEPVLSNPLYLKLASMEFYNRFRGDDVTKLLVPETSGISLATAMSLTFNKGMVIARRRKENPRIEYIEEHLSEPPSIRRIFYIPRASLTRWDRILIVDDIVQTGLTLAVMEKLARRANAKIVGVAALVVVGDEWARRTSITRVESLVKLTRH
ncbi:MAG: hypothetical protein GSR86_06860 [Desulfurococcales archaeon]|nr:hypothetical protein [Desulfurococcales archaeon]